MNHVYADDNVIVVFKPAGIETTSKTTPNTLEKQVGAFAVHRLDVNTEGLVIFAKTELAKKELEDAFKNGNVHKTYIALCFGKLKTGPITLGGYLTKDATKGEVKITKNRTAGALPVETQIRTLPCGIPDKNFCVIEAKPITGRTHQIRAHLASIGVSIAGDAKYGDFGLNKMYGYKKQCLCAVKLEFSFPAASPLAYLNKKHFEARPTFGY